MQEVEKLINIEVRGKIATLTSMNFELVCGNDDYKVVFDFDEEWEKYPAKTALFVYGKTTIERVFEGNVCEGVAIEGSTMCFVGVFAGNIATTTPACVEDIRLSIRDVATSLPQPPKEDVYNQIMELLQKAIYAHTELPVGGYKGQVLKKRSAEDYDTEWADDEGRKSEWDFVIDSYDRLGEISKMYGNVLIQFASSEDADGGSLNVPKSVKHLKIDIERNSDNVFYSIVGHKECVLDGSFLGFNCVVSGFKTVRNVDVENAKIKDCGFVYGCVASSYANCNYIENSRLSTTREETPCEISNCPHICHIQCSYVYGTAKNFDIRLCEIVENISSDIDGVYSLQIANAKTVDTVSGFLSASYNDCKYVNPYTCQDYVAQKGASGKVQVLTDDGSFEYIEISGGDEDISQRVTDLENAIYGVEEELQMLNEGGIE